MLRVKFEFRRRDETNLDMSESAQTQTLRKLCRALINSQKLDSINYDSLCVIAVTGTIGVAANLVEWFDLSVAANCILHSIDFSNHDGSAQLKKGIEQLKPAFDGRYSREQLTQLGADTMKYVTGEFSRIHALSACFTLVPQIERQAEAAAAAAVVLRAIYTVEPKKDE